jgi:O-acetyl-ADP-ribose deacetylase (regulator of RNase III)
MASIQEIKGNIFESRLQTLVNAVNCDGVMGRGIAREFRFRFPCVFESYKKICEKKLLRPGTIQLVRDQQPWVLNLPTKDHWKLPSKIEYIVEGLKKFALTYKDVGIKSVAFPRLGVSLGGLEWRAVHEVMFKYLKPLPDLEVEIYELDPRAHDSLFESLKNVFEKETNHKAIGISKKRFENLLWGIKSGEISSMFDVSAMKGIGEKSLVEIYAISNKNRGGGQCHDADQSQMKLI